MSTENMPLATKPFTSYRAKGRYGWIMIGAMNDANAWSEARRSTDKPTDLEVWNSDARQYQPVVAR